MSLESKLKTKTFYETLIEKNSKTHPIMQLGQQFMKEQQKEIPDSSYIRFSQGEIYFHYKDYEAAIYKWNHVHNELEGWAKKNSGDAYLKLELYNAAEEVYRSIKTDSLILKTEIMLQLFSLYKNQGEREKADECIQELLIINPDYPNVTALAKAFFEDGEDWENAIGLAIREGIRTESLYWFEVLKMYIHEGYARDMEPSRFLDAMEALYLLDKVFFEALLLALWNNYRGSEQYISWVKNSNQFFLKEEVKKGHSWNELPNMYNEMYKDFMGGSYLMAELSDFLPDFLTAWLKLSEGQNAVLPAAAIFAWNEAVPDSISSDTLKWAERIIFSEKVNTNLLEKCEELYDAVLTWTEERKLSVSQKLQKMGEHLLDFHTQYVAIVSLSGQKKQKFLNSFLNESFLLQESLTPSVTLYKNNNHLALKEITNTGEREITDVEEYMKLAKTKVSKELFFEVSLPNELLRTYSLSIIDLPDLSILHPVNLDDYLNMADALLFILHSDVEASDKELEMINYLQNSYPSLPIDFVAEPTEHKGRRSKSVKGVFLYEGHQEDRKDLASFLSARWEKTNIERSRMKKYLSLIQRITQNLLEQRVHMENYLAGEVLQKEDVLARLNGALYQLEDMEQEKAKLIVSNFKRLKEEIRNDIQTLLPEVLKQSGEIIHENRDFNSINKDLNDEMNERISEFVHSKIFPKLQRKIDEWMAISETELHQCRKFLDEISNGFNTMLGKDVLELKGDYKILDDWKRDVDRLKNRVEIGKENIFSRLSPSQFLLSTGRVWTALSKNKAPLVKRYKNFIEKANYTPIADTVAEKVLTPFSLLEDGIERDLEIFFKDSFEKLRALKETMEQEMKDLKEKLEKLKDNPEAFRDPLYLFQVLIMQYKYILEAEELADEVPL